MHIKYFTEKPTDLIYFKLYTNFQTRLSETDMGQNYIRPNSFTVGVQ